MPSENTKILEFNQYQKLGKAPIEKRGGCKNNPENSSTTRVNEHIPLSFSISTISSFRSIENKHDVYRDKDFMKKVLWILKGARTEDNEL